MKEGCSCKAGQGVKDANEKSLSSSPQSILIDSINASPGDMAQEGEGTGGG